MKCSASLKQKQAKPLQDCATLKAELQTLVTDCSQQWPGEFQELSASAADQIAEAEKAVRPITTSIDALIRDWETKSAALQSGEEIYLFSKAVAEKAAACNTVKDESSRDLFINASTGLHELRAFIATFKKNINKREKEDAKANAGKKVPHAVPNDDDDLPALIEEMQSIFKEPEKARNVVNCGHGWSYTEDVSTARKSGPIPVLLPKSRTLPISEVIASLDYFTQQQSWLREIMNSKKQTIGSAAIVKAAAMRKVRAELKNFVLLSPIEPGRYPESLQDLYNPSFSCIRSEAYDFTVANDYGMSKVHMMLEGNVWILGLPVDSIPGDSISQKLGFVMNMKAGNFLQSCASKASGGAGGFAVLLEEPLGENTVT